MIKKNFVSFNFEFLLFFYHGDVIWDSSKEESLKKQRRFLDTKYWEE